MELYEPSQKGLTARGDSTNEQSFDKLLINGCLADYEGVDLSGPETVRLFFLAPR